MINRILARRYAKALILLGQEDGRYRDYGEGLKFFSGLLSEQKPLSDALINPIYPLKERVGLMEEVLKRLEPSPIVGRFLLFLMEKRRLELLDTIVELYWELVDEMENIARAKVKAASELADDDIEAVKAVLEKLTGKSIKMEVKLDPALLGGVVAQVGDLVVDGSVKRQLLNIKETLKRGERV